MHLEDFRNVRPGAGFFYEEIGIYVRAGRDDDDQPFITINTEKAPTKDVHPDGEPVLCISLNDVNVYNKQHPVPPRFLAALDAFKQATNDFAGVWEEESERVPADVFGDTYPARLGDFTETARIVQEMQPQPKLDEKQAEHERIEGLMRRIVGLLADDGIDIELERCDPVALKGTAERMTRLAELIESTHEEG